MSNTTSLTGSSKQYIGVVDMLCEGPIYGLEKGMNDVYINDVPFENTTLVGSLTDSGSALSLTLTPTSSTAMTVTNGTIQETDVGKIAHIEVETAGVTSITQSSSGNFVPVTVTTITPSTTLNSNWQNYQLDKYYTIIRNTVTGRKYGGYSYWNSSTNTITMYSLPIRRGFGSAANWELVLFQAAKIATYVSDTSFTLVDALHNYSNLTNANFSISASITTTPNNPDPSASTSKVEGSTLQFRQGLLEQSPISQVHGVSGGVTKTGNTAVVPLKQFSNSTELNNYKSGSPYSGISTSGYPTGQSYAQNSGAQQLFNSSAFGTSSPSQVNEINVRINYNSLILYNSENGDKEDAYAIYVFEVRTKINNTWSPFRKLFSQYGTFIVHRGRTTAPVSFDHTIGLDRFKPFDDFELRLTRLTRDAGLPVRADGSNGGETDVDKWSLQASAATGGANLSSTIQDSFIYPHTAIAAVSFSSKTYNQLPSRSYLLKGLMIEIPTAYTPREYSSTGVAEYDSWWDGTFKTELYYTDNPAWVFYDIATNSRYGAGNWLEEYNIDKFALYRIAKYCDELVPSGVKDSNGNDILEPRFRANIYLAKATDVYKVLKDFATIFTGMLYWLDGRITPIQDVPSEPVYTFSKANVIEGRFNYESTGRKTRSNQVVVTWNDPTRNYEPVNLIVEDREDIVAQRKIISQKAIAFGTTSEGQAIRYGRWKLWTAQNQKEIVSFETGLQGAYIRPGDIINIQDRDRYGIDFSGKIADVTTDNRLLLDRAITDITDPDGGLITYEISTLVTSYAAFYAGLNPITLDNEPYQRGDRIKARVYLDTDGDGDGETLDLGTVDSEEKASNAFANSSGTPLPLDWKPYSYVVTKDVTLNTSDGITAVSMASGESWYSASEVPDEGSIFALVAKNNDNTTFLGSTKEYRVLGISFEDSKNVYAISAVEHYNSKYDAVDKDYALGVIPDNTYADIEDPDAEVPAPSNIYVVSETDSSKPGEEFRIEWDVPQEQYTDGNGFTREREYEFLNDYEIYHTVPDLDNPLFTANNSYRFQRVPDGIYTFRVRTRSRKGNTSNYVSVTYDVNDPFGTNVPRVVGGLPKGIIANSTAYDVHNAELTYEKDRYKLIWQRDSAAKGFSIANSMFGGTTAISTDLQSVGLFGLAVSGPLAETAVDTDDRPDGYTGDSEWHYLHYDGATSLSYWNTRTLDNVPFYHKIDVNGFGWRGSAQSWARLQVNSSNITAASIAAGSNRLVATSGGDFLSDLQIRDIIHFDGKAQTFEMYKIEQLREESGESVVSVHLREGKDVGDATDPGWVNGDIVTFERVSGATGVNGQYYYVKTTAADDRFQLYFDEDLTDPVRTTDLSGTYTALTGFVTRAKVKAAKVVAVIDNNTAILDRSFDEAISVNRVYKLSYRPDYNDDAVFGRVKWNGYDNVDDIHTFTVDTFIDVNEGLNVGALELTLIPSVSTIDYNGNDLSQETTFSGGLNVTAIAAGFANPQFRITKVEGAGSLDFDMEADELDIGWTNASGDAPQASLQVFPQSEANAIPFANRAPVVITGEVRESQNTGLNTTGTCQIAKVASGTDGIDGKTVEIRAEDNSIIYNEVGEEPLLNGHPDRALTFTATARNYITPEFKFTLESVNLYNDTEFPLSGNPGFGGSGTYTWGTFKIGDTEANPGVATATVTVPSTWDDKWAEEGDTKSKTFRVLVEVRESSADPVTSTDITNVTGVHSNDDGYAFVLTNPGNSISCNEVGSVTYDTSTVTPVNGFVAVEDTGTQIEVLKGGKVLSYVGPGSIASVNESTWANYTNSERLGKYRVTYTESPDAAINRGALTYNENTKIITYGPHDFSVTGWEGESAVITYALQVENLDELIPLQQSFTKSKAGFGGIRAVLSNPTHEVPTTPEGNAMNYLRSGTTLNCFMTGIDLPYYASGATIPNSVDVYWTHKSTVDTDVTVGTRTEPTDGSTAPVTFGIVSNMTAEEAEITFTVGVYIRRGGSFVEEEIDVTQSLIKNRNGAYVSAFASPQVYIYDGDEATPSPSTNHRIFVRAFTGNNDIPAYVEITSSHASTVTFVDENDGTIIGTANIPSTNNLRFRDQTTGEINSYEYTVSVYANDDRNTVLAQDTVFIYGSFTQKDNIVMELTNDSDTVSWPTYTSGTTAIPLSTTALIYKAGTLESASDWTFTFSESSVTSGGASSTSLITAAFDSTDTNKLNVTAISNSFQSGTLTITASHNDGEYDDHNAIFSIRRINSTSILRITAEPGAVTKNPNNNTFTPSNRQVTYTVRRFSGLEGTTLQDFDYKLNGGSTVTVNAGGATTHTITDTFATDADETDFSVLEVFDGNSTVIHDIETVPVILGGTDGDAGVAGESVDIIFIRSASQPSTPVNSADSPGATNTAAGWSTGIPSGTELLWASLGRETEVSGSVVYVYETPYQVGGTAAIEAYVYRKRSTTDTWNVSTRPSGGAWNFVTGDFDTVPTNWSSTVPSVTDNGDKIYVSVAVASGDPTDTSADFGTWSVPALLNERVDGSDGITGTFSGLGTYVYDGTNYDISDFTVSVDVQGLTNITYSNWDAPENGWSITNSNSASQTMSGANNQSESAVDSHIASGRAVSVTVTGTDSGGNTGVSKTLSGRISITKQSRDGLTGFLYYFSNVSGASGLASSYITASNPDVGQIAIVQNTGGEQAGYRYDGSGWQSQNIVNSDIIFANAIGAEQLEISSNNTGSNRIYFDGSSGSGPRILIFGASSTQPRVILGRLS